MSDAIAPANPAVNHTQGVERIGSDATGTESAAESFTKFLEDEEKPDPQSRPVRRANAEKRERKAEGDGDGTAGDGQGRERQPEGERGERRQEGEPEADEPDPLHDDVLDGDAPESDTPDDDTDEPEGDEPEGDDELDDADEDPEHEVIVNGEKQSVKQSELLASYSREADYRQKTEVLARDVEQIHEFAGALNERRGHADNLVQMAEDLITSLIPTDAEWAALKKNNPQAFIDAQEQWQGFIGKANEIKAKRDEANGHKTEEQTAEYTRYVREENRKLFDKLPQLRNKKVQEQFSAKIFAYGKKMGYTPDELAKGLINHRDIQTAYFAARYLEIQESRKANSKKAATKGPRQSEGNSAPRTPQSQKGRDTSRRANRQREADRELQRTGSQQSAHKAFAAMFQD
jgi:hypothetical protein